MSFVRLLIVVGCAALWLAGCASVRYQPLPGITQIQPEQGYRLLTVLERQQLPGNADDLFVVMMFSGGGTRAAALGYGVLQEMRRQHFNWHGRRVRLLDQVDVTYGVSGGSMLAAYYALHGDGIFPRFEQQFLKRNLQRNLARQVAAISNWPRLTSPEFGRGDLLEEQLDQSLFHGATFGDLVRGGKGPMAIITATDMTAGRRINFTQEYFDVLCLDLERMRLARAVAASSAVPLVFAPITLNNNGGHCHYQLPPELREILDTPEAGNSLTGQNRADIVKGFLAYAGAQRSPYLHLLDGGLTDNLGLRSLLDMTQVYSEDAIHRHLQRARRLVFISVNAQNGAERRIDHSAAVPGVVDVMRALINIPIDSSSQDSLRQFRRFAEQWRKGEAARAAESGQQPAELYFIGLQLADLQNNTLRDAVLGIPTSLYLPPASIEQLKQAGSDLLQQSPEFRRLQNDLELVQE